MPDVEFYVIGPTEEEPEYYQDCMGLVESLGLQAVFHFTGRQNVLEYYGFLDVMLLTSVREAQPLVLLEAFCAGVPVVSTRVGNVPEMLDYDEHYLAHPKDSDALAQKVVWLRNNPVLVAQDIDKFRRKTAQFHDKATMLTKFLDLYRSLGVP